jgi:hypothetical protein
MNEMMSDPDANTIRIPVMNCLHKQGYEQFIEGVEALIKQRGKINILFDMSGFHGWDKGAQWFDINKTLHGVERVAFIGDLKWEKNIGDLCKPFPKAQLRYFDYGHMEQAKAWVK